MTTTGVDVPQRLGETRLASVLVTVAVVGGPLVAHLVYPLPCPMREATGLECAGCGATRAARAVADSDWRRAADLNLLVLLIPVLATAFVITQRLSRRSPQCFYAVLTVLALWTALRNVPGLSVLRANA